MTGNRKSFIAAFLAAVAVALLVIAAAKAQTGESAERGTRANTMVPAYDLTKEVKVQGTIQKIDAAGTDVLTGTHILVQTPSGVVDAHLGFGRASNPQYLGIAPGQSVSLIGMMQTVGNTNVLLARVLTTPNHIFVLRNEHGIPVRATPRGSTAVKPLQRGL